MAARREIMNHKKVLAALALASLAGGSVVAAEEKPMFTLSGITVTATRQAEDLADVPANVQVITERDLKERNIQTAADAVSLATGISTTHSVEGTVNLRGFSTKNVLVLVDGQQMNTAWNGDVDWNMIPVEMIRKIEIVSGGQSALYGGRAVGGVINIMTKTPKQDGVHGSVVTSYGSNSTVKQSYSLSGKKNKLSWGTFYESKITDGRHDYTPSGTSGAEKAGTFINDLTDANGKSLMGDRGRKHVLSESYGFNLGYAFNDDQKLTYRYSHSNYAWHYTDPTSWVEKDGKKLWPAVDFADSAYSSFYGTKGFRSYDMHSLTYNDQKNKVHAHFGMTDYTKDGYTQPGYAKGTLDANFDGSGKKSSYPSKSWSFDVNKRWTLGTHTLLVGGSYGQDQFDQTFYAQIANWKSWNSANIKNAKDQLLGGKDKNWALYLQDKWVFAPKWTAYIGGRYDHYEKYGGYSEYADQERKNFDSASYNQFSPKLSLDYAAGDNTNFYVSFGKSFNPPILYQVYRYAETGTIYYQNPGLNPETTDTWELGVKTKVSGKTSVNVALFQANTKDYIKAVAYQGGKQYQNVGDAKKHGFEVSLSQHHSHTWTSYFNYTWQTGTIEGEKDYDIPRHLIHLGTTYRHDPWTVNLDGTYISDRTEAGMIPGRFKARDAYFLLSLNTHYKLRKDLSLQFTIDNLLDKEYYDEDIATSHYYIGPGRTYTLTARYDF